MKNILLILLTFFYYSATAQHIVQIVKSDSSGYYDSIGYITYDNGLTISEKTHYVKKLNENHLHNQKITFKIGRLDTIDNNKIDLKVGTVVSTNMNTYYINNFDTVKGYVEFWSTPKLMQECSWNYTESFGTFDRKRKYTLKAIKVINNMTNEFRIITKCGDIDLNKDFSFYFNIKEKKQ